MANRFQIGQYTLGLAVALLSVWLWSDTAWRADLLDVYVIFPLLGLLAFGLMWTHYIVGALRRYLGLSRDSTASYTRATGWIVLALILLHPSLLSLGLWQDGFGLPPASYLNVYRSQSLAVILGSLALCTFIAYELHRWWRARSWWQFVEYAQMIAMSAIFFHGLTLGRISGWRSAVWWGYGLTLLLAGVYTYRYDSNLKRNHHGQSASTKQ